MATFCGEGWGVELPKLVIKPLGLKCNASDMPIAAITIIAEVMVPHTEELLKNIY